MTCLFHHDLAVVVLGSGSRGNCTYVGDGRQGLLIDCGLSARQVRLRLELAGLKDAPIDAVLVTHEHSDHSAAARSVDRALFKETGRRVPVYMTRGTRRRIHPNAVPERIEEVRSGATFRVGRFAIEPYTVPHDVDDPVAYVVDTGTARVGVLTDLGRTTRLVEQKVASLDVAIVEFNHDVDLLMQGSYPWALKQRIRGPHGHLSNREAGDLVTHVARAGRLRELVLGHLSEENNRPEHALRAAQEALWRAGRRDVTVQVAEQDGPIGASIRTPMAEPGAKRRIPRPPRPPRPLEPGSIQETLF